MNRLHYFQHVPFEGPGVIEDWANRQGFDLSSTQMYNTQSVRMPDDCDWLIVMGGPMGVYDQDLYPWLADEKRAIARAIKDGKVVLGICLGAQLIAEVLGAGVRANAFKEIGWFPVYLHRKSLDLALSGVFPSQWEALHWHGDTFDIPEGARLLASSEACRNQGFVYQERVVGLQFHLEITRAGAAALVENCADELKKADFISDPDQIVSSEAPFEASNALMFKLLDQLNSL